ncbi:hypothetical protein SESBI_04514 [Sesbania bispinosa]|nr:hypothetical protein SESBI_04514 [Sesbania bispinosa]
MELASSSSTLPTQLEGAEISLDSECETGLAIARKTLVGRVLTDKNLNRPAVKEIIVRAWGLNEELKFFYMGPNVYVFHFKEEKDAKCVLEEGPCFYAQLHGLSLDVMNTKNVVKIAKLLGEATITGNATRKRRWLSTFKISLVMAPPLEFLWQDPWLPLLPTILEGLKKSGKVESPLYQKKTNLSPPDQKVKIAQRLPLQDHRELKHLKTTVISSHRPVLAKRNVGWKS